MIIYATTWRLAASSPGCKPSSQLPDGPSLQRGQQRSGPSPGLTASPSAPAPGHHRPAVTAHDPHQPTALVIIDLTHPHTLGHRPSLKDRGAPDQRPAHRANVTGHSTRAHGLDGVPRLGRASLCVLSRARSASAQCPQGIGLRVGAVVCRTSHHAGRRSWQLPRPQVRPAGWPECAVTGRGDARSWRFGRRPVYPGTTARG